MYKNQFTGLSSVGTRTMAAEDGDEDDDTTSSRFATELPGNSPTEIKIYPNPGYDKIYISYNTGSAEKGEIIIEDLLGQKLLKTYFTNEININAFSEGVYLFKFFVNGNLIAKQKFIKLK
ncbi:MAG: T9SS type A sorting domain-containing protein [Bacteroidia bacterium]